MANCFNLLDKKTGFIIKKDAEKIAKEHGGIKGAYLFNADREISRLKAAQEKVLAEAKGRLTKSKSAKYWISAQEEKPVEEATANTEDSGKELTYNRRNKILYSKAPGFYSQLERSIRNLPAKLDNTSANGIKAWLLSNASQLKIKQDELAFSGILDYLELQGKAKVSKDDILNFLKEGGVQVEEKLLGVPEKLTLPNDWEAEHIGEYEWHVLDENGRFRGAGDTRREAIAAALKVDGGLTKYENYRTPGGKKGSYRELLLTLPVKADTAPLFKKWAETKGYNIDDSVERVKAVAEYQREYPPKSETQYKSSHWDQPNVLGHIRFDERQDADGNRVLFIQELQSDWGQEGKRKGFKNNEKQLEYTNIEKERDKLFDEVKNSNLKPSDFDYRKKHEELSRLNNKLDNLRLVLDKQLLSAPFVQDTKAWLNLLLKRVITYAVDNGFDKVAFATGEQNADLYDLSKQISRIELDDNSTGGIGKPEMEGEFSNGNLTAYDLHGERVISEAIRKPGQLSDYIGKEAAEKLLAEKPFATKSAGIGVRRRQLTGLDLKVGGEGMRKFYDSIIPQTANDLLKKIGGNRVTPTDIGGNQQLAFDITPTMRDLVQREGLPLFSEKKGKVDGLTVDQAKTLLPKGMQRLVDKGVLNIVQSEDSIPQAAYSFDASGVQGFYDKKADKLFMVTDNLTKDTFENVLLHELNHRGLNVDERYKKAFDGFQAALNERMKLAAKGLASKAENEAYRRVMDAETPDKYRIEEFASHIIEVGRTSPKSIPAKVLQAITDFFSAIKAMLIRSGFYQTKNITHDLLAALARQAGTIVNTNKKIKLGGKISHKSPNYKSIAYDYSFSTNKPESNDIRYSIASKIKDKVTDFSTGRDRNELTLSDFDKMLETGKMPKQKSDMQAILDKAATMLVDSSRPFDVWTRKLPFNAGKLILAKDRAKRRTAYFEKEAFDKFLHPLAKIIGKVSKDHDMEYRAAKNIVGRWMTVRYALEKNQDYLRQDQAAVDKAQADLDEKELKDKEALAKGLLDVQPTNSALKNKLDNAIEKQKARYKAINEEKLVDPTLTAHEAGLAGGYNDFTAQHYKDIIENKIGLKTLEEAGKHIYDMLSWKLKKDLENGKVTQEIVDKWFNSPHYVPLVGDPNAEEGDDPLFGHGSLNQASDKRAEGRAASLAINGIDAATEAVQKSARYHGWVDFKDALTETYDALIQEKKDEGLTEREAIKAVSDQYAIDRNPETGITRTSDSGIIVRKNGQNWVYDINDKEAVDALRSVNREETPSMLQPIAWFTRNYARMVTQFMLGFGPINMIRDTLERSENIRARILPGYESIDMNKVGRNALKTAADPRLVKKILGVMLEGTSLEGKVNVDSTDPDIKMLREMIAEGGTSTVGDYLSSTSGDLAKQMKNSLRLRNKSMELISAYNNAFELVSSFSVYKSLRDSGVDKKTAASGVLNLMNFSKRGTIVGPMKALWVFLNPTMQGGHQMIQTLGTNRGRARATAYFIAGTILYTMLRAGDDDDDLGVNKMDELGNFVLERNIAIPIGDGDYIKLPVGFGIQQMAWSTAVNVSKYMFGNQTASEAGTEILKSWTRTMAPIAPSETSIAAHPIVWMTQTFTPQVVKPLANVAMDVTTFGSPLTSQFEKQGVAHALQGKKTTAKEYKEIAIELSKLGFDMYPEQVKEIVHGYAVGPLNEIVKLWIENPNKESLGKSYVPQYIDRIIAKSDNKDLRDRLFYRELDKINDAAAEESVGGDLSGEEKKLANIAPIIKKLQNSSNGKLAAAAKAEKTGNKGKAKLYRMEAEAIRNRAIDKVLGQRKLLMAGQ